MRNTKHKHGECTTLVARCRFELKQQKPECKKILKEGARVADRARPQ